jgi:pilus assembly protein Flp/PilA
MTTTITIAKPAAKGAQQRAPEGSLQHVARGRQCCSRTAAREQRVVDRNKLEGDMRQASQLIKKLMDDEKGAALVEYTVLLGVMLVAVISTIMLVGGWVSTKWSALWTALQGN